MKKLFCLLTILSLTSCGVDDNFVFEMRELHYCFITRDDFIVYQDYISKEYIVTKYEKTWYDNMSYEQFLQLNEKPLLVFRYKGNKYFYYKTIW